MKRRYPIFERLVVFSLLALSAPIWLCLRAWYGWRVYFLLGFAIAAQPLIVAGIGFLLNAFAAPPWIADDLKSFTLYAEVPDWAALQLPVWLMVGLAIQGLFLLIYLFRITFTPARAPHSAYAGSFLLRQSTEPYRPVEALLLFLVAVGYLNGFNMPFLPKLEGNDANIGVAVMVASYAVLAIAAYANKGRLPYFDWGKAPDPAPRRDYVTRRMPTATRPGTGLEAIFSRRDPALSRIASAK